MAKCEIELAVLENREYSNLVRTDEKYSLLVESIFNNARLGYDGETLTFDTGAIDILMKTFEAYSYSKHLERLKSEKEIKE